MNFSSVAHDRGKHFQLYAKLELEYDKMVNESTKRLLNPFQHDDWKEVRFLLSTVRPLSLYVVKLWSQLPFALSTTMYINDDIYSPTALLCRQDACNGVKPCVQVIWRVNGEKYKLLDRSQSSLYAYCKGLLMTVILLCL